MRQDCDICGIYSICNDDGNCADCEYEMEEELYGGDDVDVEDEDED